MEKDDLDLFHEIIASLVRNWENLTEDDKFNIRAILDQPGETDLLWKDDDENDV